MASPKSRKFMVYLFIGVLIVVAGIGLVSSAISASRAGSTPPRNPAILSSFANGAGVLIGLGFIYVVYKTNFCEGLVIETA